MAAVLFAVACNLAVASDPESADNASIYILSGLGAIVLLLTLAVWGLALYVGATMTRILSKEKHRLAATAKKPLQVHVKNVAVGMAGR